MLGGTGGVGAEERSRIFRLAWDFAGSALARRNEQYERFYLGSASPNLMHAYCAAIVHGRIGWSTGSSMKLSVQAATQADRYRCYGPEFQLAQE